MSTIPLAEVRSRLSELIITAETTHERTVITKNGRPVAVLIGIDDLESMEETLAVLGEPGALEEIRDSEAAAARGEFVTEAEVRATLAARKQRRAAG